MQVVVGLRRAARSRGLRRLTQSFVCVSSSETVHVARPGGWSRAPSAVLSKNAPPSALPLVSTPARDIAASRFGCTVPPVLHVPSSRFLPASTASSTKGSVGLLHPTADPGVHRVLVRPPLGTTLSVSSRSGDLPPDALALQSFPPSDPPCRLSPGAVAFSRLPAASQSAPQGLARVGQPWRTLTVAGQHRPWLSWASLHLERTHRPAAAPSIQSVLGPMGVRPRPASPKGCPSSQAPRHPKMVGRVVSTAPASVRRC
jgi:hypothetical protein